MVLLDRDGVLNDVVIDPEHGTVDSPLHISQVRVYPWVSKSIRSLNDLGYAVSIVTNQPAFAKGKTTRANLEAVHRAVIDEAQSSGGRIFSSHICWHQSEDRCTCRKPQPGMLEDALTAFQHINRDQCWMVGDGVTDVQAGQKAGTLTAFLGPRKCDACKVFELEGLCPTLWARNLQDFVVCFEGFQSDKSI